MISKVHKILLVLLLGLPIIGLFGQGASNPFDLNFRKKTEINLPKDSIQQKTSISKETPLSSKPSNPFDIVASPLKPVEGQKITKEEKQISAESPKEQGDLGFLFWLFLTIILLFSAIYGISRERIEQLYHSFLNENFLRQLHRQNQGAFSVVYLVLYLFAFFNLGILVFHCLNYWEVNIPKTLFFVLQLIGVTALILLGKHLLLTILGIVFPIHKEISLYNFTIMTFWILIGIFLLPINILIAYAPSILSKYVMLGAVGVILVVLIYRGIRGISIGSKYLFSYKFHFFIYLCTIEVLPFIILLKFFQNYTEATLL